MAYSPIEQGRLLDHPELRRISAQHRMTPAQIALAWVLRRDGVIAIPRAADSKHVRENRAALEVRLTKHDLAELDRAFAPPNRKRPLELI
jgi:diketogulonate reductase-like aldo/keto reductase